jgi:hypothetical protein
MRVVAGLVVVLFGVVAGAQQTRVEGHRATTPPSIDGVVDDGGEWAGVPAFGGLRDFVTGNAAPEEGRFWIAYDKDFIYFAARLSDSQPSTIKATEYRTNVSVDGDDNVQLFVDLSGSLADFNAFSINPRGATDIQLAGGRAAKREWQGEFLARARVTETGWECEARIPWQIMRLPSSGVRDVRFTCVRSHKRTARDYTTAFAANQSFQNAGFWTGVEIPKTRVDRSILLLPYSYLGYGEEEGPIVNSGIDLKTRVTEEIPAVVSINPDFRNIENQILSLDFSRFERLAGETRPFFQEGIQYFNSALFASQRIKGFDAGLNVHGKLTDTLSFGVMDTATFGTTNNLVTNFSFDPDPNNSFRVTTTSQMKEAENNNSYLVRYSRQMGPLGLFLRTMGTKDSLVGNGIYNTALVFYNVGPFNSYAQWDATSADFLPRLGFAPETDYKGIAYGAAYSKPVDWGTITEAGISLNALDYKTFGGDPYRDQYNAAINLALKDGTAIDLVGDWETFMGSEDHYYQVALRRPRNDPYNYLALDFQVGEFTSIYYQSMAVRGAWRPSQQLQLTGSVQIADFGTRSEQAIVGFNYDLGGDQSVSGRMVRRDNDWNAYVALRRSGNKGTEYFLILGDPNASRFQSSLILKVTMPFTIKG